MVECLDLKNGPAKYFDINQNLCLREVIHVKNLLSFGHCPFGGRGVKPISKKIWTATGAFSTPPVLPELKK